MTLVVFVVTFVVAGGILVMVLALARGERASWFKGVSPAILSPLGVIFGLMVVFIAAQVWSDIDRAQAASRSASHRRSRIQCSTRIRIG